MNSWNGTALSPDSLSAGRLSSGIACILNPQSRSRNHQSSPRSGSRRLAYEAADCGLLSPDLAAGIRRVKGVKKIGVRLGNWLTAEQSQRLWQAPNGERLKEGQKKFLCILRLGQISRTHTRTGTAVIHLKLALMGRLPRSRIRCRFVSWSSSSAMRTSNHIPSRSG